MVDSVIRLPNPSADRRFFAPQQAVPDSQGQNIYSMQSNNSKLLELTQSSQIANSLRRQGQGAGPTYARPSPELDSGLVLNVNSLLLTSTTLPHESNARPEKSEGSRLGDA